MRLCQDNIPIQKTARLVLADGTVFEGYGFGATGSAVGEVCFNTSMTGYQEILTDPSYAQQIVTFTFPHIGNVGANWDDLENATDAASRAAVGAVVRAPLTASSNFRSNFDLDVWMARRGIVGISGVDTRALTARIRETGMPHGTIAHQPSALFDLDALQAQANDFAGLVGADLASELGGKTPYAEEEGDWDGRGFVTGPADGPKVVVIDYGVKRTILRRLVAAGCRVSVLPATTSFDEIMQQGPEGVVLSNGPGDPAAAATHAVPVIQSLLEARVPTFGICLGHQLLAIALGAKTMKMPQGHHGANHPVQDLESGKVEIVSMNHGFAVDEATLPDTVTATYRSLFDGSNAGIACVDRPALSVQHHPEAGPGPQDSFPMFDRFVDMIRAHAAA